MWLTVPCSAYTTHFLTECHDRNCFCLRYYEVQLLVHIQNLYKLKIKVVVHPPLICAFYRKCLTFRGGHYSISFSICQPCFVTDCIHTS